MDRCVWKTTINPSPPPLVRGSRFPQGIINIHLVSRFHSHRLHATIYTIYTSTATANEFHHPSTTASSPRKPYIIKHRRH